jgi:glutathione S-transferase
VSLIFGALNEAVPQTFIEDRSQLRGAPFDVKAMNAMLPQLRDQFRAHLGWIETQLSDSREGLLGEFSLADVNAYINVWYVRSLAARPSLAAPAATTVVTAGSSTVLIADGCGRGRHRGRYGHCRWN